MNKQVKLKNKRNLVKHRVRARITANSIRPRFSVNISSKQVYAQIIDDTKGVTLASASSLNQKSLDKKPLNEKASWVGTQIAKNAKSVKVTTVIFDRGNHIYHGRVKTLAEAARKQGLKF